MFHTGFGYCSFSQLFFSFPSFGGELTVKLPFRTKHINTINISDLIFLLSVCFRFLLFIFIISRGLNKGQQRQWNQTTELIYHLNHQRRGAVMDVIELQKLIWSETFGSEPLQFQHRKAPVLHPTAAAPQLALPWLLSGSADLGLGWAEHRVQPESPLFHTDGSVPSESRSDFSTSTSSITSFIANWFLWGVKRFLQKAAPENNPCHVGLSQQSASGLNLIRWHSQCISNNFGGKNTTTKKVFFCSLSLYYKNKPLRLNIKWPGLNCSIITSAFPVVCNMVQKQASSRVVLLWKNIKHSYNTRIITGFGIGKNEDDTFWFNFTALLTGATFAAQCPWHSPEQPAHFQHCYFCGATAKLSLPPHPPLWDARARVLQLNSYTNFKMEC